MSKDLVFDDKQNVKRPKPDTESPTQKKDVNPNTAGVLSLQQKIGNQAVQRLLAQRSGGEGAFDLDDETANQIDQARGGGQSLDNTVQTQMSTAMAHDFSGVRVHTSPEADQLNQQLSAKAFTTGQDIFFREGEYNPSSSGGQELLAHELSHVVQQSTGQVGSSGSGMTVNAPDDAYEQEADSIAKQVSSGNYEAASAGAESSVQRQDMPMEEEELQTKSIQRQDMPMEEEELQTKAIQRQEAMEEEELQTKAVQRQDAMEEEELQTKAIQRQEAMEEEELQTKAVQREEAMEEEEVV